MPFSEYITKLEQELDHYIQDIQIKYPLGTSGKKVSPPQQVSIANKLHTFNKKQLLFSSKNNVSPENGKNTFHNKMQ